MSKSRRITVIFTLAAVLVVFFAFTSLAGSGKIFGAAWDEQNGVLYWENTEDNPKNTTYTITLFRGTAKKVAGNIRTKDTKYDFASIISNKGTGVYYAIISIVGIEDSEIESEKYTVESNMVKALKARVLEEAAISQALIEEGKVGWIRYPGPVWKYKNSDGSFAIGWLLSNGKWYYLADDGIMLTGWQIINNRWYYLDEVNGDLYVNRTTPDGMTVNGNGECVVNGTPVDGSWQPKNTKKNSAKILSELTEVKINSTETKVDAYVVRPMRVTSSGRFTVETYSFSKPYEQWVAGEKIRVTCTVDAYTGYAFTERTKITFNRGTLVSNTGDSTERVIVYDYYPRYVLATPANLYVDDLEVLHWGAVRNANRYIVSVYINGVREQDKTIRTNSFDLGPFISEGDVGVKVVAIAPEAKRNYWYDSFPAELEDVQESREQEDPRVTYEGNRIRYVDAEGNPAVGWAMINGYWYHFTKGLSEKPGWFCDADKFWYYFDDASRMKTGYVTDGGKTYFLNDGSVKDIPLGAWVP